MEYIDTNVIAGNVIIPAEHPNPPEPHEISAAWILARHYHTTVKFLIPVDDYMRKTPDIVMHGVEWEMKSPTGKSKHTVSYQFKRASKQSNHLVFDGRRTSLSDAKILSNIRFEFSKRRSIKRLIFITKSEEIVEFVK